MQSRINIITLGVKNLARSKKFYEDLGWTPSSVSNEHFVCFSANGVILSLYPEKLLEDDVTVQFSKHGYAGITIAHSVSTKEEVKEVLDQAAFCGAKIIKPARDVFWGGHSGYFSDPDGHLWEVAWNPHWALIDGQIALPE